MHICSYKLQGRLTSLRETTSMWFAIILCIQATNSSSLIERMAVQSVLLILALEGSLRNSVSGAAFVSSTLSAVVKECKGCRGTMRRARHHSWNVMHGEGGTRGDVVTKAVAAGLLGLQLLGMPIGVVTRQAAAAGVAVPRFELITAGARDAGPRSPPPTEKEMIDEVEKFDLQFKVEGNLKKQSKIKPPPLPDVLKPPKKGQETPRVELVEIPKERLEKSVQTIQGLSPYLDEVEYLITARKWDYLKGFLGVFGSCEDDFVNLIDGMYPTQKPVDVSSRDSMQLEAQNVFLAVDDLYQASMSKKVKGAEKAFVKLALAYDRFMKAGNILPVYDPVSSTEKFFNNIPDEMLRYERDSKIPLDIRDAVLILKGPDMGRTGKIVGIIKSRSEAIVRVDGTTREMRILELSDIARQLPDDSKTKAATRWTGNMRK